ncbi:MFS transporter [Amycolatopsis benzoatilytica]|uniref:MFS transporter n=1 Tax=Amycolatopsis benzoatilytica TaxID=346045 RepID=UPI00037F1889|nr:MFS transporter [Amycolatopsis benzoatilytica]
MTYQAPGKTASALVAPSRRRWFVFAVIAALNFGIWLDEAKVSQLAPFWSGTLHLTPVQISSVLSAYLLGYAPMLAIAGVLADRFGSKILLLICGFGVTILSVSMVFVQTYTEMWWRNLAFGFVFGLLLAPSFRLLATWFPAHERTKVTSLNTGACAGISSIVTPLIALPIANHLSWQLAFVVVAVFTVPPLILLFRITDQPRRMRGINAAEVALIEGTDEPATSQAATVGFRDMLGLLRNRSVLLFGLSGLLISPIWLSLNWLSYGLINLDKVDPDVVAVVLPAITLIPLLFSFVNGHLLLRVFQGRARLLIATGFLLGGIAFLIAALVPMGWVPWALLLGGAVMVANLIYFGTMNAYWAEIAGPRFTGGLSGITSCLQVAAGVFLVNQSGSWFDQSVAGHAQLTTTMVVGGVIMLVALAPVLAAKEVRVQQAPALGAVH